MSLLTPIESLAEGGIELLTMGSIAQESCHYPDAIVFFYEIDTVVCVCFSAGCYGTAVLYRKKDDDSLVILKEINIHDLNANERLMAKNEVSTGGSSL